jgi:uncharacterized protein YdeI (YjbR/CyaY-like superfamily)
MNTGPDRQAIAGGRPALHSHRTTANHHQDTMGTRDPRVDAYIAKSPEFARPILAHIREVVHAAVPEAGEEMKWSAPAFTHKGILCIVAAFKQHCAINFWKGSLIVGDDERGVMSAGQFGRITTLADLPPDDELAGYLREAKRLNDEGVKDPNREKKPAAKAELAVPDDFAAALAANPAARATFDAFAPSKRKDYLEWITEAKTEATRKKRLDTSIEWLAEGKSRMWKYEKK